MQKGITKVTGMQGVVNIFSLDIAHPEVMLADLHDTFLSTLSHIHQLCYIKTEIATSIF